MLLDKSIKLNSMNPTFYILKTNFLNNLNQRGLNFSDFSNFKNDNEAITLLDESIKLSLMNLELYSFKTKILNDLNKEKEAKENSIKKDELNKELAEDFLVKGINSMQNKNFKNALDYFNEAISRDIENDFVYFCKAFSHMNLYQFKKAIKCLDMIANKKLTDLPVNVRSASLTRKYLTSNTNTEQYFNSSVQKFLKYLRDGSTNFYQD